MNKRQKLLRDIGVWKKTVKWNQPMCFKHALASEWKSGIVLSWEKGYDFFFQELKSNNLL